MVLESDSSVDEDGMFLAREAEEEDTESDDSLVHALDNAVREGNHSCPVCGNTNRDTDWIQCDACEAWFHYSCINNVNLNTMTQEAIESLSGFRRDFCI